MSDASLGIFPPKIRLRPPNSTALFLLSFVLSLLLNSVALPNFWMVAHEEALEGLSPQIAFSITPVSLCLYTPMDRLSSTAAMVEGKAKYVMFPVTQSVGGLLLHARTVQTGYHDVTA